MSTVALRHLRVPAIIGVAGMMLPACLASWVRADRNVLDQVRIPTKYEFVTRYDETRTIFRVYLAPPTDANSAALVLPRTFSSFPLLPNAFDNYTRSTGWKPLAMWDTPDPRDSHQKCGVEFELAVDISKVFVPGLTSTERNSVQSGRRALIRLFAGCD